ncbi:hypothetical protein VZ95_00790 [Elstera litoralis]|uniref:Phosphomevalonate dehydratase small subunit-like domain-containing protein n=2 Tax=Elstera litoralis TaxID=552518 RepID=A0A0F3IWN2_9PROT|nr:hypothetical protein VZ95_00790 [Elstera litoralis]
MIRAGRAYAAGEAEGLAVVLTDPLSFWGGVAVATGAIIDRSHPQVGQSLAGKILVMPCGRGSSSASSVLAECLRLGTGPLGILLARPDPILTVAALVAEALYDIRCPIVVAEIDGIATGDRLRLTATGSAAQVVRL